MLLQDQLPSRVERERYWLLSKIIVGISYTVTGKGSLLWIHYWIRINYSRRYYEYLSKNQKWCLIRVVSNVWHVSSTSSPSVKEEKVSFQKVRRHFLSNDPMMEETSKMTGMRSSLKTSLEQLHRWINLAENMAKNCCSFEDFILFLRHCHCL